VDCVVFEPVIVKPLPLDSDPLGPVTMLPSTVVALAREIAPLEQTMALSLRFEPPGEPSAEL